MSPSRTVFLDIDGTYAFHGAVPKAHEDAVRQARANGHKVFLCTGRPLSIVTERIRQAGFDGLVCGAGAYVEIGGQVLRDDVFPPELADRTMDALAQANAQVLVEATEALYMLRETHALLDKRAPAEDASDVQTEVWDDLRAARVVVDSLHGLEFGKVISLSADAHLDEIAAAIGPEVAAIQTSLEDLGRGAGELYMSHINKAVGLEGVVEHLGATAADAIAVGDGPNDIEMFEHAGTRVGIAGGHPRILELADIVAESPAQAGLVAAFAELEIT